MLGCPQVATEIAAILPFRVMGDLMGIERKDEPAILRRVNALLTGSDPEYRPG